MSTPERRVLCLYSAARAYVNEAGIVHDVLHLYATGHTTSGTPMDEWDWPSGLDLWDLVDTDVEVGRVLIDSLPFQEQWLGGPAQVIALERGDVPPDSSVMAQGEFHVACDSTCTAPGAEARQSLADLRVALHRTGALEQELTRAQAEAESLQDEVGNLLIADLRRDLDG